MPITDAVSPVAANTLQLSLLVSGDHAAGLVLRHQETADFRQAPKSFGDSRRNAAFPAGESALGVFLRRTWGISPLFSPDQKSCAL
jgi:hypothetical protein